MSVGVIAGSSSGISTTVKAELHHFPISTKAAAAAAARAGGGGLSLAPVKSVRFAPRRGCGSLRSAPSPPAFSSSSFRARATVEDGVVEEAAGAGRKSFYDLLGIPQGGSSAEIKRAYKEMARRYHPDVCPSPDRTDEYTRRFIEVQEAYETLSDPGRRARYDRDLARGLHLAFSARRRSHRCYHDEMGEDYTHKPFAEPSLDGSSVNGCFADSKATHGSFGLRRDLGEGKTDLFPLGNKRCNKSTIEGIKPTTMQGIGSIKLDTMRGGNLILVGDSKSANVGSSGSATTSVEGIKSHTPQGRVYSVNKVFVEALLNRGNIKAMRQNASGSHLKLLLFLLMLATPTPPVLCVVTRAHARANPQHQRTVMPRYEGKKRREETSSEPPPPDPPSGAVVAAAEPAARHRHHRKPPSPPSSQSPQLAAALLFLSLASPCTSEEEEGATWFLESSRKAEGLAKSCKSRSSDKCCASEIAERSGRLGESDPADPDSGRVGPVEPADSNGVWPTLGRPE
ncbi:hypothetical protein Taro_032443 [Colocasia esculenta]|uniref:J domain-containing protein n=1 Tax=Colocasia esculenta TaxID=4460 RepID=A0A843VUW7_COLES|nr:hypothetical protein [Colocasia esculenta]